MQQEEELSPDELTALLSSFMPEIPGYRVLRRIGKGGMSQVYLGVQESLDRQVAVKVMSPAALTDEISKQRFEHEARTAAGFVHPNAVTVYDVGDDHVLLVTVHHTACDEASATMLWRELTESYAARRDGPFEFRHEPRLGTGRHVVCGHLHPVLRLPTLRRQFPAFSLAEGTTSTHSSTSTLIWISSQ